MSRRRRAQSGLASSARACTVLAAALLLVVAFFSMQYISRQNSPTWDETHFWGIGWYLWKTGSFDIPGVVRHPPLTYYLNSAPILWRELPLQIFGSSIDSLGAHYTERGNELIYLLGWRSFLSSRTAFVLAYCLTGWVVFLWSRRWWGAQGGLFALIVYLACPTLMAHGFLMTTDALMADVVFLCLAALVWSLEEPSGVSVAVFVLGASLPLGIKITGAVLGPFALLCVAGYCIANRTFDVWVPRKGRLTVSRGQFLLYWTTIGGISLLGAYGVLVLLYQGDWRLDVFRATLVEIRDYVHHGHPIFLDGRVSVHGFPEYYLKALAYKTPLPIVLAWVLAVSVPGVGRRWRAIGAAGKGILILAWYSFSGYTLGLRFVLLAMPLFAVAAGRLGAPGLWMHARRVVMLMLGTLAVVDVASFYPYPRSYVDRAVLRRPAYEALADSDLDWGEGLVALSRYVRDHRLGPIALSYHGSVLPWLMGIPLSWYENPLRPWPLGGQRPNRGLLFVSATNLSGLYFGEDRYRWLRKFRPVDVVGGTIYVFDLDKIPDAYMWR